MAMFTLLRDHLSVRDVVFVIAFVISLALAVLRPLWGDAIFRKIETLAAQLARRKTLAILAVALFPIILRLSLLPLIPVPVPHSHDEFSYLLEADTFASHRLTNPPHPMSLFFDTIHVNQYPTYMSKYPPAQGAVLALGQRLGNPWIGVLLSVSIMCGATLWMLQGWLPPSWALVGGVLVLFRTGIFSYWMNGYWGGAVPAIGGALVLGALPRILHSHRPRFAIIMGVGAAILMNSRPYEGFSLCLPVATFLVAWLFGRRSPSLSLTIPRLVLPCCAVVMLSLGFVGYYNWRGTGNAFLMPYMLNEHTYWSTPTLLWQNHRPAIHFSNPQFEEFYNGWARKLWEQGNVGIFRAIVIHALSVTTKFVYFFLWPEFLLPLVVSLYWVLRDRRVRFLVVEVVFCFVTFLPVAWFQPHYAAPLMTTVFALLTQSMRHLRRWEFKGRGVGIGLTRVVLVFSIILAPFHPHSASWSSTPSGIEYRAMIETQLNATPGNHLVVVRYSPRHDALNEWVYNKADIDNAKAVWAREIPGVSLQPLLDYFGTRRVWLVEPDSASPRLIPYAGGR
jgi:hypothetical protein